ncbi:MAG: hypothetical protein A2Z14_06540 [Chloroflexi bacterium RBG_16_48_8]|nr:MAG: hypothetical protein A2Z14_06540 [Chloroflexi bacterium RBG_16_48_8]
MVWDYGAIPHPTITQQQSNDGIKTEFTCPNRSWSKPRIHPELHNRVNACQILLVMQMVAADFLVVCMRIVQYKDSLQIRSSLAYGNGCGRVTTRSWLNKIKMQVTIILKGFS